MYWELCKKFKFDNTYKLYMHNPESVLENETHKLIWDFDIQTDHLISAWQPDLVIINKKKRTCRTAVLANHWVKSKVKRRISTSTLLGNWKTVEESIIPIVIGALGTIAKRIDTRTGGLRNNGTRGALLRSARILRRVLETWGDVLSFELQWKTISER